MIRFKSSNHRTDSKTTTKYRLLNNQYDRLTKRDRLSLKRNMNNKNLKPEDQEKKGDRANTQERNRMLKMNQALNKLKEVMQSRISYLDPASSLSSLLSNSQTESTTSSAESIFDFRSISSDDVGSDFNSNCYNNNSYRINNNGQLNQDHLCLSPISDSELYNHRDHIRLL